METIINVMPKYEISIANQECLEELSRFVVEENYKHHSTNPPSKEKLESDIMTVYNEEKALYSDTSNIYIARYDHKIIGSIRVFKWDRKKELPIERMYGINPLKTISHEKYAEYWHIGRFAIAKDSGISTLTFFTLCKVAPSIVKNKPLPGRRFLGTKISYICCLVQGRHLNQSLMQLLLHKSVLKLSIGHH